MQICIKLIGISLVATRKTGRPQSVVQEGVFIIVNILHVLKAEYSVMATGGEQEVSFSASLGSEDLSEVVCGPCQEDGELHKAVGMCADCQDHLCQRCFDVHKVARPFKRHKLLNKQQMLQCQVSLNRTDQCTEKCSVHDDEFIKFFCLNHSQLGCGVCISLDHRLCDRVTYIQHAVNDLANNEEYQQAVSQLKSVEERSRKLAENYKQKIESLGENGNEAIKSIQEFRQELNNVLDNIETDLIKSCETLKSEEIKKMSQIMDSCKTAQTDLCALATMVETYEKNKQNCNLYTLMMKTKDKLKSIEEKVKEAENGQSSINSQIKFVANKETIDTVKPPKLFGKLTVSGALSCIEQAEQTTAAKKEDTTTCVGQAEQTTAVKKDDATSCVGQAELTTVVKIEETINIVEQAEQTTAAKEEETRIVAKAEYVQDIKVKSESDRKICFISGMVVLSDNRIFIADFNNGMYGNGNVKLVDIKHNTVITHLKLSSSPWDVAKIKDSQVVVTLPCNKKVVIVSVADSAMNVDSMFDVDGECRGVDYRDGKLAVSLRNPDKIQVLSLQGTVLHTITADERGRPLFNSPFYVIIGQDTASLFVSNWGSHNVVHVKLDGTVVGTYTDGEFTGSCGLLTDSSGHMYVCGEIFDNIHQITPDCRKIQVFLTSADGLSAPKCISYSEAESRLYVGMYANDVVKMYKVTPGSVNKE